MQWSEAYSTGIARIDDQHKMLFQMADSYRAALDEGKGGAVYGGLLHSLDLYVRSHFAYEEGCMARHFCPAATLNQDAHRGFITFLNRFHERHASHGFVQEDARELVDTIDAWLVDHICRIDTQLKPLVTTE
jgi:hemerythrin